MRKIFISVMALLAMTLGQLSACTNFIITKGASADGSCMVTYSADSHTLYGELYYTPAADHPAGSFRDVVEWDTGKKLGQIPQIPHTYSVVGNMNEYQLAIGETTYGGRAELEGTPGLIDYGSLIYITLERAKNAREAIKVMSELLEAYGYCSSGESFSIIDPNEAWIFEIIGKGPEMKDAKGKIVKGWSNGAVWVARRIPDGYISGHANQARITNFPLRDGKTSITSKEIDKIFLPGVETVYCDDVIAFAKLKGYYPQDGADANFSFCDAFAPLDFSGARFCESRVWMAFYRCSPSQMAQYEDYARGENLKNRFPLWIKPDKKVTVQDVMQLMRDHFEGTSMDMTKDLGAGPFACPYRWRPMTWSYDGNDYIHERATATQQTGFSFVAQARPNLPNGFGGILWFGVDDAGSSCYMPMFCGILRPPAELREGNGSMTDYSSTSAYWTFTKVSQLVYTRYSDMIKHVNERQQEIETAFVNDVQNMQSEIIELYKIDPSQAQQRLTDYSASCTRKVCTEWNRLFEYLLVKYNDGNVKKEKEGRFVKTDVEKPQCESPDHPEYSQKWYKMIVDDCGNNIKVVK
ncbi:MAG: C69 family dipeptidase [Bacteroidales bacterium]|jgi:dipeptidase|nr:C69 family dipeptidase [Bacteroidales bacterium]